MTAAELWNGFCAETNIKDQRCEAWAFGGAPDELAALVLSGEKTATASAFPLYELTHTELPRKNAYSVILNARDEAVCIIRTTKVYVVPFCEASPDHAYKEGEGDKSLEHWRTVHRAFFTACMEENGLVFDDTMPVVCEEFEVVYK